MGERKRMTLVFAPAFCYTGLGAEVSDYPNVHPEYGED
jgi:hypothetical protein